MYNTLYVTPITYYMQVYAPCLMQIWNQLSWHFLTESGKIHVVRSGVQKKIKEWAQSGHEGLPPAHRHGSYKKFITY